MPLNPEFVGREYPASETYEVSRELIRRFAAAIGDANPAYTDIEAAKADGHPDVIAPPTFLTVLGFRYSGHGPLADPSLGLNYALVVHGEQRFVHHRPVRAGDVLTVTSSVVPARAPGGKIVERRAEGSSPHTGPVSTSSSKSMSVQA